MRRTLKFLPLISILFLIFASCSEKYLSYNGKIWGTSFHITYKSSTSADARIDSVFSLIDSELSMFNPASTVSAINAGRDSLATTCFRDVFDISRRVNVLSAGCYDPTVGPLSQLWGFGTDSGAVCPDSSAVLSALEAVGIARCRIDSCGIVRKKSPATVFDFSSVAKGYGVDLIARMFDAAGIVDYLIEVGGEIRVSGVNPKGRPWRVQVDAPVRDALHSRLTVLELGPEPVSVASSGNYRNFRADSSGRVYGHTLSPLSGYPIEGDILAATVVTEDCALADALATACMASGCASRAIDMLREADVRGLVVAASADTMIVLTAGELWR